MFVFGVEKKLRNNFYGGIFMAKVKAKVTKKVSKKVKKDSTKIPETKKPEIVHIDVKEHNKKFLDTLREFKEPFLDDPKDYRFLGYITMVQIGEEWLKLTGDTIIRKNGEHRYYILGGKRVDQQCWERQLKLAKLLGK